MYPWGIGFCCELEYPKLKLVVKKLAVKLFYSFCFGILWKGKQTKRTRLIPAREDDSVNAVKSIKIPDSKNIPVV